MVGPFTQTLQIGATTQYRDVLPLTVSSIFRSDGGRFLTLNTSTGFYGLSAAADTQVDAWLDNCFAIGGTGNPSNATPFLSSTVTDGLTPGFGTKTVYGSPNLFLIPIKTGSTIAATNLDQEYDIVIEGSGNTTKQLLDITAQTKKVLKVVSVDVINNLAIVTAVQK